MLRVLDGQTEQAEWHALWAGSGREPFAHPAYAALFAAPEERTVLLAIGGDQRPVLVPLIIRPATQLPWATGSPTRPLDATSPYGYGGPFGLSPDAAVPTLEALHRWGEEEGLASTFLRLSLDAPCPPGSPHAGVEIVETAENVRVDLRRAAEDIWRGYEHKVRKNVKKAVRAGCTVERHDDFAGLDSFLSVYHATMSRRNAAEWYRFDRQFFATLAAEMPGCFTVFYVRDAQGRVVSTELVLQSDRHLYSFLGGTLAEAFPMAPNDLLKHHVIEYGRDSGRDTFVLGGGARRGDGIFSYKRSFDPTGVRMFCTARIVNDDSTYAGLVDQWREHAGGRPAPPDYFPAYRAPLES
ncbi:GNAT family N-acetyltransferase [Blastococcus sp. SYSU DS0552]